MICINQLNAWFNPKSLVGAKESISKPEENGSKINFLAQPKVLKRKSRERSKGLI